MTTLVTGATGFVGSAVARRLIAAGHEVRLLVREASTRDNLAGLDVELAIGDLRDPASLARAVRGCDTLVHVAADYRLWVRDVDAMYQSNVTGTVELVRQALDAGVGRVVYTSSVATLGLPRDGRPGDETTPVGFDDMIGHYKRSKFLAERVLLARVREDGWPVVIVNPSTPIGPRDIKPTPTGRMVLDAARGKMPAYVDTGLNVVHVDDVAEGHLLALRDGKLGERYVLGGDDMSLREILTEVATLVQREPPKIRLPHLAVMPVALASELLARFTSIEPVATLDGVRMARKRMFFSSAKAKRELGYSPRPAREALNDAVAWFRDAGYL